MGYMQPNTMHLWLSRREGHRKAKPPRPVAIPGTQPKLRCSMFSIGMTHLQAEHGTAVPVAEAFRLDDSASSQVLCQPTFCIGKVGSSISRL